MMNKVWLSLKKSFSFNSIFLVLCVDLFSLPKCGEKISPWQGFPGHAPSSYHNRNIFVCNNLFLFFLSLKKKKKTTTTSSYLIISVG